MAYSHIEIRKFVGLYLQPNTFQVPDGALEMAKNCVIAQDETITARRGFPTYYTPLSGTLNNLAKYQNHLIAFFNTRVEYDNSGFVANSGSIVASGRTVRYAEANQNLYFTTDEGTKKLTSFSSAIQQVGVPPALDLRGLLIGSTGWFTNNTNVAYRVLFGIKDANKNTLLSAPSDVLLLSNTSGGARTVRLEFSIPSEITSVDYFVRIYRSSLTAAVADDPLPDYRLVKERQLTATEVSTGLGYFIDDVEEVFREEAAELYTNPNSREGELQANTRPPLARDLVLYKGFLFYLNCLTRHQLSFYLVSTSSSFINNNNYVEFKQNAVTRRYVARAGSANRTVAATVTGTTVVTIVFPAAHGLVPGDVVFISGATGGTPNINDGSYLVTTTPTGSQITATVNAGANSTACYIYGQSDATSNYIFELHTTGTFAEQIDFTARALVKAVDRDLTAPFYAKYLSSNTSEIGQILLESKTFDTNAIQARAETTAVGQAFSPEFPAAFGTTVQSEQESLTSSALYSKYNEPEAVPRVNEVVIGSKANIQRGFALRDSLVVIKEDGVFRIDGDSGVGFAATIIDNTVLCLAENTCALINNQVFMLTNQGVCAASSTSVEIIGRNIELPLNAVLGSNALAAQSSAVGYETERLYILTTLAPQQTVASEVYVYNTLNHSFTTWDTYFKQAVVGPNDRLYYISLTNTIKKERKEQNKLDYTEENYNVTVNTVLTSTLGAQISSPLAVPQVGDVLVKLEAITRISGVIDLGANVYSLTFESVSNLVAADTPVLYKYFLQQVKHSPFHGGNTNRAKQFAQFQVHTRDRGISLADIYFSTDSFGSSEVVTWKASDVIGGEGWGSLPWGTFPWGLDDSIDLTYNTQPAPIIRVYVPLFAQRGSWIQAVVEHRMAAEPMNIQAIGYQIRGYGERVTR